MTSMSSRDKTALPDEATDPQGTNGCRSTGVSGELEQTVQLIITAITKLLRLMSNAALYILRLTSGSVNCECEARSKRRRIIDRWSSA